MNRMALSLLQQPQHTLLDFQSIFEPHSLPQCAITTTKFDFCDLNETIQMEFYQNNHYHPNGSLGISSAVNNPTHNHSGSYHHPSTCNYQTLTSTNTNFHHLHFEASYEQVINFVDSPPNSEESWADDQSKGSPGPQIIDVQTIYSNTGTRKRRMDWDSLDISNQGGNGTSTQSGEIPNKIPHHEKDKQKKEKANGRSSWPEEIGFDLNADFNSNSYLNNESFLTFSPAIAVLKQESQADLTKVNKSSVNAANALSKVDKASSLLSDGVHENHQDAATHVCKDNGCVCSSPQISPHGLEPNDNGHRPNDVGLPITDACQSRNKEALTVLTPLDSNKLEIPTSAVTAHSEDHKFQYILAAATSIATKNNEDTLTYLNQGQSYEIKLKKIGDLSYYRDKILKSVIKICFHERRLQFMEREQMQQWQSSRPGERIIEVDVPLSYGLCHVSQSLNLNSLNTVEVFWDPLKEVGVYIKVNCISTEFTPKKHGGEKGVPFRLQIETYIDSTNSGGSQQGTSVSASTATTPSTATSQSPLPHTGLALSLNSPVTTTPTSTNSGNSNSNSNSNLSVPLVGSKQPVHAAACQIKVFKLKGADRKHKQDREKIQKRPLSEQDKFQPSYECTIMGDIPLDLITPTAGCYSPEYMKIWPNSPVHIPKYDGMLSYPNGSPAANSSPIAINSVTSSNSPPLKSMDTNIVSPQQLHTDMEEYTITIMPESTPAQVTQWLTLHRLTAYLSTFAQFSGADIMRMSKEDLIQICGLADGIRMFNILRAKAITPRLTMYVSLDGQSYSAIYLLSSTAKELTQKLTRLPGFYELIANSVNSTNALDSTNAGLYNGWSMHSKYSGSGTNIYNDTSKGFIHISGPSGVHVTVTDEVLNNEIKDGSLFALEMQNGKVIMKLLAKND